MRMGRALLPVFAMALAANIFWQVSDDKGYRRLLENSYISEQKRSEKLTALCQKYSTVTPLSVPLQGKTIAVLGRNTEIANHARTALPDSTIFVNGIVQESLGPQAPVFVRSGAPADAFVIRMETREISESGNDKEKVDEQHRVPKYYQVVTVSDPMGGTVGQWQGFLNESCRASASKGQISVAAFLASQRSDSSRSLLRSRARPSRQLAVNATTIKVKYVARAEDFSVPASMPNCVATLFKESNASNMTLQIATSGGTVWFRHVRPDQTLPAVACNAERTAIMFRTASGVSVVALGRDGNVLGWGRVDLPKSPDREIFRDMTIDEDNRTNAVLASFKLDRKGTMVASEGRLLAADLGAAPIEPRDPIQELKLTQHSGCVAPPPLDSSVQIHELPNVGVSWEYVQLPGQEPVPFTSILVDAPLQKVAVSFPDVRVQLLWLIQATPGTDLRYVEVAGRLPQVVLLKDSDAVVNVAMDDSCATLFSGRGSSRKTFNIRTAYAKKGEREALQHVLLGNGHPLVSAEATRAALGAYGYQHFSSLSAYFSQLKSEGAVREAAQEDLVRFRDYYYDGMSLPRKFASWFKEDPALVMRGLGLSPALMVETSFPLPRHPEDTYASRWLLVEKGVPLPKGDIGAYTILDANTLTCPGRQTNCPWARNPH